MKKTRVFNIFISHHMLCAAASKVVKLSSLKARTWFESCNSEQHGHQIYPPQRKKSTSILHGKIMSIKR
jgi:hypothetical protein